MCVPCYGGIGKVYMTKITAHAGCEGTLKGTMESIEAALRCGADVVEVDLRLLDGEIYLSHDALRADALDTYLTFRQVLGVICSSDVEVNCDIKEASAFPAALHVLRDMGIERRAFFTGDTSGVPELPTAEIRRFLNVENLPFVKNAKNKLSEKEAERLVNLYRSYNDPSLAGFNVEYTVLTEEAVRMLSSERVLLSCWLVNDRQAVCNLLDSGIAYLTTDCVKYAVAQRNKRMRVEKNLSPHSLA